MILNLCTPGQVVHRVLLHLGQVSEIADVLLGQEHGSSLGHLNSEGSAATRSQGHVLMAMDDRSLAELEGITQETLQEADVLGNDKNWELKITGEKEEKSRIFLPKILLLRTLELSFPFSSDLPHATILRRRPNLREK